MAYFANGSEGATLDAQCDACPLSKKSCPVYEVQSLFNYEQLRVPTLRYTLRRLVGDDGRCRLRPLVVETEAQP